MTPPTVPNPGKPMGLTVTLTAGSAIGRVEAHDITRPGGPDLVSVAFADGGTQMTITGSTDEVVALLTEALWAVSEIDEPDPTTADTEEQAP